MENLFVGLVRPEETEELMRLYRSLIHTEHCTWSDAYPDAEETQEDVKKRNVLCLKDWQGRIIGAITLCEGDEELRTRPCFAMGNYHMLARLGVAKEFQGRGLAKRLFIEGCQRILWLGYAGVCFLVAREQACAQHIYESLGARRVDAIHIYDIDFYVYEISAEEIRALS